MTAHSYGGLAQMGERLLCTQEVRSSILLSSTMYSNQAEKSAFFIFVNNMINKVSSIYDTQLLKGMNNNC